MAPPEQPDAQVKYRADIDGLRSLAIAPIVLFHAGFSTFSGGFVGVDIFFVISGYLITSIIANEVDEGRFDLWRFYERRIRRIFPALLAMLLASSLAAWWLLFPLDLQAYGESVVASTGFFANISFWRQSGYFDTQSDLKPLLHTWSLAVEEQFYLFFPLLLLACHRLRMGRRGLVWALLGASFALSLYGVSHWRDGAFYLIPTRAWELLMGAVLALRAAPTLRSPLLREGLAGLGLALIGAATFAYDSQTPFPGLAALPPCLGSALIIWTGQSGQPTLVARLLSLRGFVLLGLVSYSLYLWHWPVIVFSHHWSLEAPTLASKSALVLASLACAFASWRWIEGPTRRLEVSQPMVFASAGLAALLCFSIGGLFWRDGFVSRYPLTLQKLLTEHEAQTKGFRGLMVSAGGASAPGLPEGGFVTGDAAQPPQIAIWGDSHVGAILSGLNEAAKPLDAPRFSVFALGGCRPIVGVSLADDPTTNCKTHNDAVLAYLKSGPETKVILVSRWPISLFGDVRASGRGAMPGTITRAPGVPLPEGEAMALFGEALGATIDALEAAGKQVFLVETIVDLPINAPHLTFKRLLREPDAGAMTWDVAPYQERFTATEALLERLQKTRAFRRVRPREALCAGWACAFYKDGRLLYTDNNHLSRDGALALAPLLREALTRP
jgi:peptidoglycan/LPS O-acetylase OafA/YrhL